MAQNLTTEPLSFLTSLDNSFSFIQTDNVLAKAALVFFTFIVIAFFVRVVFVRILQRLVKGTKTEIDDKIIETAKGPVLLLIITLGFFESGRVLNWHLRFAPYNNIFFTILSILVFWAIVKIIMILAHGIRESLKGTSIKVFDKKIFPMLEKILKMLMFIVYLFVFFEIWDINLTPLLAGAGVAGLAIAFAAQDSIANIFGGFSIFADKAYEIGDYIIVDDKYRGEVIDLGLRSTKLKTRDDVLVVVPNSVMSNTKVVNESGIHPKLRVRVDVDVAYDSDLDKVEKVLLDIANKSEYAEKKPEPRVRFRSFKDFSIHAQLSMWIKRPALRGRIKSYAIKDIHKRFKKEKIEMPFPTYDVFVKK